MLRRPIETTRLIGNLESTWITALLRALRNDGAPPVVYLPGKPHCAVGTLIAGMPSQGLPVPVTASIISVLIGFLNPSRWSAYRLSIIARICWKLSFSRQRPRAKVPGSLVVVNKPLATRYRKKVCFRASSFPKGQISELRGKEENHPPHSCLGRK